MSNDLHADDGKTSKLLFKNRQWAVTDYGIEALKTAPYYPIPKKGLLEVTDYGSGEIYEWPVHVAEKTWVDKEAFIEVFLKAVEMHGFADKIDQAVLDRSLSRARKEARIR